MDKKREIKITVTSFKELREKLDIDGDLERANLKAIQDIEKEKAQRLQRIEFEQFYNEQEEIPGE